MHISGSLKDTFCHITIDKEILISTHNVDFYGEISKNIS